jgi:hypothetical protein
MDDARDNPDHCVMIGKCDPQRVSYVVRIEAIAPPKLHRADNVLSLGARPVAGGAKRQSITIARLFTTTRTCQTGNAVTQRTG